MDMAAPLMPEMIEWKVEHHFWIVMLRLMVRVVSCIVGEMRNEGLVADTLIRVGGIIG